MPTNYGPQVTYDQLQEGVRIYYTGDVANQSDFGAITKRRAPDRWNYQQVDIILDDGRECLGICLSNFQPAPGRRFWLEADWKADQADRVRAAYIPIIDWDDAAARARLVEQLGADGYTKAFEQHCQAATVATVNGYAIRPVGTRFGRIFMVGGTRAGFHDQGKAENYAKTLPPK